MKAESCRRAGARPLCALKAIEWRGRSRATPNSSPEIGDCPVPKATAAGVAGLREPGVPGGWRLRPGNAGGRRCLGQPRTRSVTCGWRKATASARCRRTTKAWGSRRLGLRSGRRRGARCLDQPQQDPYSGWRKSTAPARSGLRGKPGIEGAGGCRSRQCRLGDVSVSLDKIGDCGWRRTTRWRLHA